MSLTSFSSPRVSMASPHLCRSALHTSSPRAAASSQNHTVPIGHSLHVLLRSYWLSSAAAQLFDPLFCSRGCALTSSNDSSAYREVVLSIYRSRLPREAAAGADALCPNLKLACSYKRGLLIGWCKPLHRDRNLWNRKQGSAIVRSITFTRMRVDDIRYLSGQSIQCVCRSDF